MKRLILAITFLVGHVNLLLAQETKMLGTGVVFAKFDFKNIKILNNDGSVSIKIDQTAGGELKVSYAEPLKKDEFLKSLKVYYPYYSKEHDKYKTPLPEISIRAYYPDYTIIVFDAIKNGEGYRVFINGVWKTLRPTKAIEYQEWASYMKRIYVTGNKIHPVYKNASNKSQVISDSAEYSYKVLEVKGDWIKVQCSKECEGCPDGKVLSGWIKWKSKGTILINLSYAC